MIAGTLEQAARWMNATLEGPAGHFQGVSTDTRALQPQQLFFAIRGQRFDGHRFVDAALDAGAAAAVVDDDDRSHRLPYLQVDDTTLALGRMAAAWRGGLELTVLGITGSNGKTTVKEMVAGIVSQRGPALANRGNLNNQIGLPLTLMEMSAEHRYAVVEMGASAAGEIAYLAKLAQPNVAVLNNAGPAHLEGFGSIDGVARAKGEIFSGLAVGGVAIFNGDDHFAPLWRSLTSHLRRLEFGLGPGVDVAGIDTEPAAGIFTIAYQGRRHRVHLPLPGLHNTMNALAAAAVGIALDMDLATISRGLEATVAAPGRLQTKVTASGVTVVDDTYNANPESLGAALEVVAAGGQRRWLVLGDMAELGVDAADLHARAGRGARSLGFDRLYSLGPLARAAAEAFGHGGHHYQELAELCDDLTASLELDTKPLTVLVKGSRSMRMERVVAALTATGKAS